MAKNKEPKGSTASPEAATAAPESLATPVKQGQPGIVFGKGLAWLKEHWWAAAFACAGALLYPALNVIGTSAGNGALHAAGHVFTSPTHSGKANPDPPLAVTTVVSYSDALAVALDKPISSGIGYAEIVGGLSDISGNSQTWDSFLARNYGAPVSELHADITFTGQARQGVRVTNIQVERVGPVRAPLSGTYIPIPHAGGQAAYRFSANMDAPNPVLTRLPSGQTFPDFNVQLSQGAQVTLAIDFFASRYSSRWILHVTYLIGAHTRYLDIREPNNQPFAVTAPAHSYKVRYVGNYPTSSGYHLKR
jgi:hypothetical protein